DGVDWTLVTTANSPVGRHFHAVAYDSLRGRMVLFGGVTSVVIMPNDTWEFDGGLPAGVASTATTYGAGCGTPALGFFPTSNPIIGSTVGSLIVNAPTLFAGVSFG